MEYLNSSFDTDFELPQEEPSLGKESTLPRIRGLITHQEVRNIGFQAKLDRVQYGSYKKQRACLLSFQFSFFWPRNTNIRFKSANITIFFDKIATLASVAACELQEDEDEDNDEEDSIENIPHIICLFPDRIYGESQSKSIESSSGLKVSVGVPVPSPASAGLEMTYDGKVTHSLDRRMSIEARMKSSVYKFDSMDTAIWSIAENSIQCIGIPFDIQAGLVLRWPVSGGHVRASIIVEPEMAYPIYKPWQAMTAHKLRQRCRNPIVFDGETAKNDPIGGGKDFGDESFDWTQVVSNPSEYSQSYVRFS
ncbi:uncharacterized protein BKA55DRAFT_216303 [Fusarium redolens]|uniref:Uncharacterized protein n=1 Tax=Fusarium redolens TaxID=48865 RepID=A0A9P9FYB7_FUSRE|nr:uncharacterized protein BKA55DRAFT_216303 [Fusarium redolens]KAH7222672.1 hypothetical protein BKA55DRAFT_216303 [Fusarium redolens]